MRAKLILLFFTFLFIQTVAASELQIKTAAANEPAGKGGPDVTCDINGGVDIPDDNYDGTVTSMACLTVAGPGGIINDMNVELFLEHTWVGDLTVFVVAPDDTLLTIVDRPGRSGSGFGSGDDLVETDPVTLIDGAAVDQENMGQSSTNIVCQDDGVCDFFPSGDDSPNGTDFSDFFGMESAGNWRVCVGDSEAGDAGQLCNDTTINFGILIGAVAVPTPADGVLVDFGTGNTQSVSIFNDDGAGADTDLSNIQCGFTGGDAAQFSVVTGMPAGPVAPGATQVIDLSVAAVPDNTTFSSTLSCTFDGDLDDSSFSWPVSAQGVSTAIATSSVADGNPMNFGTNPTFSFNLGNDAAAQLDLININCGFTGGDATQFSVVTAMPAGPIAPGGTLGVDLSVNAVPVNTTFTSTLTCSFVNDPDDASFSWPVSAQGATTAVATSTPVNGAPINFGAGSNAAVVLGNDASALLDLANINCAFAGGDATEFGVITAMPAGPIAPGGAIQVDLAVNPVPANAAFSSTLTCSFDNDVDDASFSWPAGATGPVVVNSNTRLGLLLMIAAMMLATLAYLTRRGRHG